MIYITEAHASDEWPVGEKVSICTQPITLQERINFAKKLQKETKFLFQPMWIV